jgi:hypothetical protein
MKDKNTTKKDLHNLKNSVEVPIIAHSHEMVIPVAYVSSVKKYLDQKGIRLPLTKHKLHDLQEEAKAYAKGGMIQTNKQSQKVIVNIHPEKKIKRRRKKTVKKSGVVGVLEAKGNNPLWNSLTPISGLHGGGANYAAIRPMIGPSFGESLIRTAGTKKDEEDARKKTEETIEKYKKELEEHKSDIVKLIKEADDRRRKEEAPLVDDGVLRIDVEDKGEPDLVDEPKEEVEEYEGWDYIFTFVKNKKKYKIYAEGKNGQIEGLNSKGKWINYEKLIEAKDLAKQNKLIKTIADEMRRHYG